MLWYQSYRTISFDSAPPDPHPDNVSLVDRNLGDVFIFYFVFVPPGVSRWKWLLPAQLKDLKATGLLDVASLTVIAATDPNSSTATKDMMLLAGIVEEIAGTSATVTPRYGNRYEYWGLYSMWEKAMSQDIRQREDSVFLYMHSKGMVYHNNITEASRVDRPLFTHVIEPWREVLFHFSTVPELQKAGFAVHRHGYIFYNYIWVRSSYVARLEAPIERPLDRHRGGGGGVQFMMLPGSTTSTGSLTQLTNHLLVPMDGVWHWRSFILEFVLIYQQQRLHSKIRIIVKLVWVMLVCITAVTSSINHPSRDKGNTQIVDSMILLQNPTEFHCFFYRIGNLEF